MAQAAKIGMDEYDGKDVQHTGALNCRSTHMRGLVLVSTRSYVAFATHPASVTSVSVYVVNNLLKCDIDGEWGRWGGGGRAQADVTQSRLDTNGHGNVQLISRTGSWSTVNVESSLATRS